MKRQCVLIWLVGLILLGGCSGMERSEAEKIRKRNSKFEMVYRSQKDVFFPISHPRQMDPPKYPWQTDQEIPKITKDFFRCRGSLSNPPYVDLSSEKEALTYNDCDGGAHHGLPMLHGQEGVYSILLDLLNFVQKKTGKKVMITSGHRCPVHNKYVDCSKENRTSKYQIGAAVDFYVIGMEDSPLQIVDLLQEYYRETPVYQGLLDYQNFTRYTKPDSNVSTEPWMNKEIYIKLNMKEEGRNFDNQHPFPYISLQVRFDRIKSEKVAYDWNKAQNGYLKKF